jgi:nucleotide-binding universal stress UspA family protein
MTYARRRSYEAGHKPKFLVIADGAPESIKAVRFGARRAARLGASLILLTIVKPPDHFEWLGVGQAMQEEAEEEAQKRLDQALQWTKMASSLEPEQVVQTGLPSEEIMKLIESDEDISFLVLAAGIATDGPGPLITALAAKAGSSLPIPLVIVPGGLSDEEIDALAG